MKTIAQKHAGGGVGAPASGPLSRRTFLQTAAAGAAAATLLRTVPAGSSAAWAAPAVARKRPPNFLFINVDQLSLFALPQFGGTQVETPNIDRLARRGTSFELSHCADPLCSPSRTCWFTGRAPTEHGVVYNNRPEITLRPEIPDLGAWLRDAGYETFYSGKWHVPGRRVESSFHALQEASIGEHSDVGISRVCEALLANRTSPSPFFLTAAMVNPHDACGWLIANQDSPKEFRYPGIEEQLPPLPPNFFQYDAREPEFFAKVVRHGNEHSTRTWTDAVWRYYIWSYYRQVEMVDASLGRILDALEGSPHADNTLIVFTSDHGDAMTCHRLLAKRCCYDRALRVPLIVSWPGQVAENRIDRTHLTSGLDLTPTLCDYASVAPPPDQRGLSLRSVIEGGTTPWRDHVVSHNYVIGRAVRSARYKYIAYQGDKTEQLFDMLNDPHEQRNLCAEAAAAGALADHRRMLAEWESHLKPAPEPSGGWLNVAFGGRLEKKLSPKPARKKKVVKGGEEE